jgi:hypothetical protein
MPFKWRRISREWTLRRIPHVYYCHYGEDQERPGIGAAIEGNRGGPGKSERCPGYRWSVQAFVGEEENEIQFSIEGEAATFKDAKRLAEDYGTRLFSILKN